ncbi:MAG: RrF2 family transcriptional regulator [Verrucomicrobiales bacterium]
MMPTMLSLSQSVGYAVRALACMESGICETSYTRSIAECCGVPPAYLAKIFKRLVDAELLQSKRGWAGGTKLARPPESISLYEIAAALEGEDFLKGCLLGEDICSDERACPTHFFWKVERARIEKELKSQTLAAVIEFEKTRLCRNSSACAESPTPPSNGENVS